MPQPPAPPSAASKKKRQRMLVIGAAGALLLVFLYLRSRSSSTGSGTSAQDLQNAQMQGAQQQAQTDAAMQGGSTPSTFADNGANAAALGETITSALAGFENTAPSWYVPPSSTGDGTGSGTTPPTTPPPNSPITINISPGGTGTAPPGNGTKAGSNTKATHPPPGKPAGTHGAIEAPSGSKKPPPKAGYRVVGSGAGNWVYVPIPKTKKTGSTSHKQPNLR